MNDFQELYAHWAKRRDNDSDLYDRDWSVLMMRYSLVMQVHHLTRQDRLADRLELKEFPCES